MILNHEDILEILPHRYPMLLVDKIIELEPMKSCLLYTSDAADD